MDFHAPIGQRTPYDVDCIEWKCSEGVGQPGELPVRQDPTLALRVNECERVLAAAIAAKPPPPPPRSVGCKAGEACFSNPLREACGVGSTATLTVAQPSGACELAPPLLKPRSSRGIESS